MKLNKFTVMAAGLSLMLSMGSCDEEKDLVIIEGNLPIKTNTLYMVGDATPNGWSIDSPTALTPTEADPLVFTWEGNMNTGEMKLCLVPGSWDVGFIRPLSGDEEITKAGVESKGFQMHAGDPDEKWRFADAGKYNLTFDLRNWTMSVKYLGEKEVEPVQKDPIEAEVVYIVGDATPNGWNIDAPTEAAKTGDYTFVYEGPLGTGELKACTSPGSWDVEFIRPQSNGVTIGAAGVESPDFVYTTGPDDKWVVTDAGNYRLTFDLKEWTIRAEYLGAPETPDTPDEPTGDAPLETETLYMIGDATPGGWSMDNATAFTRDADDPYLFTWEGDLVTGEMKACLQPDGTFSCPFLRPETAGTEINGAGLDASKFVYNTDGSDPKWKVTEAGKYRIVFNLKNWTITVTKI